MYPGHSGARYNGLGTQTLAPKKGFCNFLFEDFFKTSMENSVLLFNLCKLENVLQRNQRTGTARDAFLEHLETQGLKISANHGGGKGEGGLQDVTGLPKKALDMSLTYQK